MKIVKYSLMTGGILFGLVFVLFTVSMHSAEKDQSSVLILPEEETTLVFYKDDCSDCQSVFPFLYLHHLFNRDLLFVNLNQPENQKYIADYQLTSVPTFIKKDQRYQGSTKKEIKRFLTNEEESK